jgi:hypothetical protein
MFLAELVKMVLPSYTVRVNVRLGEVIPEVSGNDRRLEYDVSFKGVSIRDNILMQI